MSARGMEHLAGWLAFNHPGVAREAVAAFAARSREQSSIEVLDANLAVLGALESAVSRADAAPWTVTQHEQRRQRSTNH